MSDNESFNRAITNAFDALGHNDHNMRRDRPYSGQPWTDTGTRGAAEIKGITFRDLRDCFIRAVILSAYRIVPPATYEQAEKGEDAALCPADLYGWNLDLIDPLAISQNLGCEVEKLMGVWPNVPALSEDDPTIRAIRGEGA